MVPLFPGVPGGPELLVVLLLMVALFGLPVVLALLGWRHLRGGRLDEFEELESRVEELESELGVAESDASETGPTDPDAVRDGNVDSDEPVGTDSDEPVGTDSDELSDAGRPDDDRNS